MMEIIQPFRDLNHLVEKFNNNSTVNQMVGANAIFYADEAVNEGNPSGAIVFLGTQMIYCRNTITIII